ncbi:MAG: tetratricopeptide repeat protein [Kiritimatiellia bacterium]|nr:tetratricopeptide repeat protein [Kiritimatiellia bacterium]
MTPDHPLWAWLFRAVWALPFGDAVIRANGMSALFATVAVCLLYGLVSSCLSQVISPSGLSSRRGMILTRIAGLVSALSLLFSSPFWVVATRAHHAPFDVALFLGAVAILVGYSRSRSLVWLYGLAFVWGIGTVEYTSFIIFSPFVIPAVLLLMWHKGQLRALPVVTALVCGLLGLSLYLVAAWGFYGSEGYEIREYPSYFKVIWFMWRDQYSLITSSLPREGWLLVLLTTGVPWLIGLGVVRKGVNDEPGWSDYLLHLVLSAVCGIVLMDFRLAPWAMLGHARLLVMPYVLTSLLAGYLAAFWLRQALGWGETPSERFRKLIVQLSAVILVLALLFAVASAPFRNYKSADARQARVISECADIVLDTALDSRTTDDAAWVVADGALDDQIMIKASERHANASVINLRGARSESYLKYLATTFTTPRRKNLARVGMVPLLRDLFGGEPSIRDNAVVFGAPDVWGYANYMPIPDRLCFRGAGNVSSEVLASVVDRHKSFWNAIPSQLSVVAERDDVADPLAAVARHLLRQGSMVANNLGVLLEDRGMPDRAFDAYTYSHQILPDNVSAVLNMVRMINSGHECEHAEQILSDLQRFKETGRTRHGILELSVLYGYVRDPDAFVGIARTWALTGQPHMAAQNYAKAMNLESSDQQYEIKERLAGLYLDQSRDQESEALFYELVVEDPENKKALMGLVRLATRKGDLEAARMYLATAKAAGVPDESLAMERAVIALWQSDDSKARVELEALIREDENRLSAWRLLVDVLVRAQDWRELEKASDRLRTLRGGMSLATEARAVLALRDADTVSARRLYREALTSQPNSLSLLQRILRLDLVAGDLVGALEHARVILQIDEAHALANYVVGMARMNGGEIELAEDAFRRSLESERQPEPLNDLAWLLSQKGDLAEAENLAREAVAARPKMHQAWDTLGEILLRQGKLEEAEEALQKALSMASDVGILLHMAQLQAAKGDKAHAREIITMIADKTGRLSSDAKADFDRLQRDLGDG